MMARRTCVGATKRAFRSDTVLAFDRIIENQRVLVDYLPLLLPSHAFSSFSSDALGGSSEDPQQSSSYRRSLTIHQSLPAIRSARQSLDPSVSVGFVPTMGALHEGHAALVREARSHNDIVVASIFVNPAQFGPHEDLDKYPRSLGRDVERLLELGVDHLFAPDVKDMYGENHITYVVPEGFDELTEEGRARPGHFRGVATIVTKLLNLIRPTRAYFGQKDAAQCVVVRRIVTDLNLDVECVAIDTIRESDGLALSSRNAYLSVAERAAAPVVYRALSAAQTLWKDRIGGSDVPSADELRSVVRRVLAAEPLVEEIQYVSVDDPDTMQPLDTIPAKRGRKPDGTAGDAAIVSVACRVGSVRLIDNVVLKGSLCFWE